MKVKDYLPTYGDRVRSNGAGNWYVPNFFVGTVAYVNDTSFGVKRDDGRLGSGRDGCWQIDWYNSYAEIEVIGKESIGESKSKGGNMELREKFVSLFKKEPLKSFRKAGVTNGDDELTQDGQTIFLSWLLQKHGDEFKKEVVDEILKEEKKEK